MRRKRGAVPVIATAASLVIAVALAMTSAAADARTQQSVVITSASHVNRHAQVTWTLAPGWVPNVIAIASSPAVASDGSFFQENIEDGGILDEGQTQFLSSLQLDYGTYYVRVQAYAADFSAIEWSATAVLTIAAPAPPPPALPPTVKLAFTTILSNRPLRSVQVGQTVEVSSKVTGDMLSKADWALRGRLCLMTKRVRAVPVTVRA